MFDRIISLLIVVGLIWNGFPVMVSHAGAFQPERGYPSPVAAELVDHSMHDDHGQPAASADEIAADAPCHGDQAASTDSTDDHPGCCDGGTCRCGCLLHSALPTLAWLQSPLILPARHSAPRLLGAAPNHDDPLLRPPA